MEESHFHLTAAMGLRADSEAVETLVKLFFFFVKKIKRNNVFFCNLYIFIYSSTWKLFHIVSFYNLENLRVEFRKRIMIRFTLKLFRVYVKIFPYNFNKFSRIILHVIGKIYFSSLRIIRFKNFTFLWNVSTLINNQKKFFTYWLNLRISIV